MKTRIFTLVALLATSFGAWAQGTELWTESTIQSVETWSPNGDCVASYADGKVNVTVGSQAGWQWGAQVKLQTTGLNYSPTKQYDISFTATASQEVGGVTFKVDDNTGIVFEDQTINIAEGGTVEYSIKNVDGKEGNGIWVFDFGWAAAGTEVVITDFSVVEHEPVAAEFPVVDPTVAVSASSGVAANAIDGDLGTRWESSFNDNQWWCVNYGSQKEMDNIKITWEGAYGSTFEIYGSNDCENWDEIASVADQTLAGFPYVQVLPLNGTKKYQYVLFRGIKRGTGYGYSFWEFETYKADASVLTEVEFAASAAICKVGEQVALTVTPKDQYGVVMEATPSYTVTPSAAGHVVDGQYVADAAGLATITATCGSLSVEVTVFNYAGENVALSTNLVEDNKIIDQSNAGEFEVGSSFDAYFAVDDNEGSVWQGSLTNGGSDAEEDRTYDAWFVVDLGASYDVELVTINFEGACSQDYHVDFSADNASWATAFQYVGTAGIQGRTDYLFPGGEKNLTNNEGVRYVRFYSTKAGTQWGVKVFSFKVFAPVATTAISSVSTTVAADAIYNIAGQQVAAPQRGINIIGGKKYVVK